MPAHGKGRAVTFVTFDLRMRVHAWVGKRRVVDLNDLVPRFAVIDEQAFERAEQAQVFYRLAQLFLHFAHDRFGAGLAEIDPAADGPKAGLLTTGSRNSLTRILPLC